MYRLNPVIRRPTLWEMRPARAWEEEVMEGPAFLHMRRALAWYLCVWRQKRINMLPRLSLPDRRRLNICGANDACASDACASLASAKAVVRFSQQDSGFSLSDYKYVDGKVGIYRPHWYWY